MLAAGAFWFLGVYGLARFFAMQYRMWAGDTVFPVRGLRVLVDRIPVALPDLAGKSGNFRGLIWRGIDDGLACRARGRIFVVGQCRASGEQTLFEAVVPAGYCLLVAGHVGFALTVAVSVIVVVPGFAWASLLPLVLLIAILALVAVQVLGARKTGRQLAGYVAALAAGRSLPDDEGTSP